MSTNQDPTSGEHTPLDTGGLKDRENLASLWEALMNQRIAETNDQHGWRAPRRIGGRRHMGGADRPPGDPNRNGWMDIVHGFGEGAPLEKIFADVRWVLSNHDLSIDIGKEPLKTMFHGDEDKWKAACESNKRAANRLRAFLTDGGWAHIRYGKPIKGQSNLISIVALDSAIKSTVSLDPAVEKPFVLRFSVLLRGIARVSPMGSAPYFDPSVHNLFVRFEQKGRGCGFKE